jgi:NhaP-type Na+/H+ or K+/H+ antiporter
MRSVLDFYRARPVVGVVVFAVGLVVAVATTSLKKGDGIILPIAFVILIGLIVGSVVAFSQRNRRAAQDRDLEAAFHAAAADGEPHAS